MVKNVVLGSVCVFYPNSVLRAGAPELADIQVPAIGIDLDPDVLDVVKRDNVARLQAADGIEGQALQLDSRLQRNRRTTNLLLQMFVPVGLCLLVLSDALRITTVVFSRVFCGTITENVERTGPRPTVTLMQAA